MYSQIIILRLAIMSSFASIVIIRENNIWNILILKKADTIRSVRMFLRDFGIFRTRGIASLTDMTLELAF